MKAFSLASVAKPAETIAWLDSQRDWSNLPGNTGPVAGDLGYYHVNWPVIQPVWLSPDICGWGDGEVKGGWGWPANNPTALEFGNGGPRHNGGFNVAFHDGHCKWMRPEAVAAGTNFGRGVDAVNVVLTDKEKYLWDRE